MHNDWTKSRCWEAMRSMQGIPKPAHAAQDAPFFTVKLGIKVLPAVLLFLDGVAVDRTVGFADFGAHDNFPLAVVERRLARSGVLVGAREGDDSEKEDELEQVSLLSYNGSVLWHTHLQLFSCGILFVRMQLLS